MSRKEILDRFRTQVAEGRPIIGGGAGTGSTDTSSDASSARPVVGSVWFS